MARSEDQQLKLLYLWDYLLENTDTEHTVTAERMIEHLKNNNFTSERKSLYRNIELLNKYYFNHIEYDKKTKGYHIIKRDFELQELQLIIDGVQSSKFITQRMADRISKKIKSLASKEQRKLLDRHHYVANRIRNQEDSAFLNIDDIHTGINDKRKISFRYFEYNLKKKRQYKKTTYVVSPFALQWSENNYYLIAYVGGEVKHFRVDKIDNISVLEDERDRDGERAFKAIDLSERAKKMFSMFGGTESRVKIRFANYLVDSVIERFGYEVGIIKDDNEHFIINVNVEISKLFWGWLVGFGRAVKVLEPEWVVDEFSDYISKISQMYKVDKRRK